MKSTVCLGMALALMHAAPVLAAPDALQAAENAALCEHFRAEAPANAERKRYLAARIRDVCAAPAAKARPIKR